MLKIQQKKKKTIMVQASNLAAFTIVLVTVINLRFKTIKISKRYTSKTTFPFINLVNRNEKKLKV